MAVKRVKKAQYIKKRLDIRQKDVSEEGLKEERNLGYEGRDRDKEDDSTKANE